MFQRIKGAIDRGIAEEQARHRAQQSAAPSSSSSVNGSPSSASRNGSAKSDPSARRPPRPKKGAIQDGDVAANPDPAVFEAAFVIDDSDEPGPAPGASEATPDAEAEAKETHTEGAEAGADAGSDENLQRAGNETNTEKRAPPKTELPPDVRVRLRKLEKLEATYPELLRSYRIAHGRAISVEPFEKALRENTPLTSIRDPEALVEYLNQVNMKGDMIMDELKRVTAEKDSIKKQFEAAEKELVSLKEQVTLLSSGHPDAGAPADPPPKELAVAPTHNGGSKHIRSSSAGKSPVSQMLGIFSPKQKPPHDQISESGATESEEFFSFDKEIPQLQAEVATKSDEIETLKAEAERLKVELSAAREEGSGLADRLESATRELSESRDSAAVRTSLETQLEARNVEIASLTERLGKAQSQLQDAETKREQDREASELARKTHASALDASHVWNTELQAETKQLADAKALLSHQITDLSTQIELLKKEKSESDAQVEMLTGKLQQAPTNVAAAGATAAADGSPSPSLQPPSSKKKGKRRKNNNNSTAKPAATSESTPGDTSEPVPPIEAQDDAATDEIVTELAWLKSLKEELLQKDELVERLSNKKKTEEDLREEIETLQDNLVNIGQDFVDAKEKIKALESDKTALKERTAQLERELESAASAAESSAKLHSQFDTLKQEYDDLTIKSSTLQSDLGAAQQLAQSRYKDLAELRDVLQKAQPELRSLRQESAALKTTRDELAAKSAELRNMEKKEKELKTEITRVQRLATDRETETRTVRDKLTAETNQRLQLENEKRVAGRDLRRAEAEKIELSAKEEKASRDLQKLREEMAKVQPRVKELEGQLARKGKDYDALQETAELRSTQYVNAQNLLGSMRDQTAELSVQLKESQAQAESLDEELAECRKLLGERTGEAETMRRLLADVDERADGKVREMRAKLDAAVEERDRLEEESSTLARRKAREMEELRTKLRDLEREAKALASEKDELERHEKEWRRAKEELTAVEDRASTEAAEMRSTVSSLRSTLDVSEQQVRAAEKQNVDLRRVVDELRQRNERQTRELKARPATAAAAAIAGSGRSSTDSSRSGPNGAGSSAAAQGGPDVMYLKTILLQFLEQKDNKLRAQLVPVLGKLLRFDRADEQKWLAAVQHISAR